MKPLSIAPMRPSKRKGTIMTGQCRGFTILEAMIAMTIFAVGMMALAKLHVSNNAVRLAAGVQTQGTILAVQAVERLMLLPDQHPDLVPAENRVQTVTGNGQVYRVAWSIHPHGTVTGLKDLRVTVRHMGNKGPPISIRVLRGDASF